MKLVIVGDSAFAEIAYEYFSFDSDFEVVAFSVESDFISSPTKFDLPVIPFQNIEDYFSPSEVHVFVAVTYQSLNRLRTRLLNTVREKGYSLASYISTKSFVWRNVEIGENVFIFEDNTIQPFAHISDNVILWSGNHVGHHSVIHENCFISSHVVISGFCVIHQNCFVGVNTTIANNISIGTDTWLNSGSLITSDIPPNSIVKSATSQIAKVSAKKFFKVKEQ